MNGELLERAYARIGDLTPMVNDCGALCGAACCHTDDDGQGGVYLFPGEAARIENCAWVERIVPGGFAPVMLCDGHCDRDLRPLGCRIFPLTPVRGKSGRWTVRMDARARAMCPLVRSGVGGLDPDFVKAARDALRIIAEDEAGDRFLDQWCALEEEYRKPLW